jgi:MFS family permease
VTSARGARFNPVSLDAINFLLADVRGALGPYLNVFLVTQQHWSLSEVGVVTTIGGLLGIAAQTPIGAAIDETRAKRGVIILALAVLALGALIIFALPNFWPVLIANCLIAIVGDVFGPAVAALTLGLYARKQLARRMGRNSAFDHAGNVAIAVVAGAVGYEFSQRAVFLLVPICAVLAGIAVLSIPYKAIDFERARDLDRETTGADRPAGPAGYSILFQSRPLVIFGLCVMLFHFANAPLLPLVGQKLAAAYPEEATAMMSACIVAAQAVMLLIALLVGRTADSLGTQTFVPGRVRHPADPSGALHPFRQQLLADRRPATRWRRRRSLRRPYTLGDRRYHARHRTLQFGSRRHRHGPRDRRLAERAGCRRDRRSLRIQRRLSRVGRCRGGGADRLCPSDAGNRRTGDGIAAFSTNGLWLAVLVMPA